MKRTLATISVGFGLAGCAFHQKPYVAHDAGLPLNQTSVFSGVTDTAATNGALEITAIDGRATSCAEAGCPVWARVAPGKHAFSLRFNGGYKLQGGLIKWQTATLRVDVPDMKALHVYHARHELTLERINVNVSDLGERPKHGLNLGLEGANRKYYPVEF
jgi:hypothetical protein